jgi:ABC-type branched-subunit amino acid transport system ATPase component
MQSDYENILQVDGLSKYFGGLAAVSKCSIKIKKGSYHRSYWSQWIGKDYFI